MRPASNNNAFASSVAIFETLLLSSNEKSVGALLSRRIFVVYISPGKGGGTSRTHQLAYDWVVDNTERYGIDVLVMSMTRPTFPRFPRRMAELQIILQDEYCLQVFEDGEFKRVGELAED